MAIRYVDGDATQPVGTGVKIIPHVCNDIGAWGRGFVMSLSKRWKKPEYIYRQFGGSREKPLMLGSVQNVWVDGNIVVSNMVAQHDIYPINGKAPIRYDSLMECMEMVAEYALEQGASIHAPKFGSDLAGGSWQIIEGMINEIWISKGIPVTVYNYVEV